MMCSSRPGNRARAGPARRPAAHGTAAARMRSVHIVPQRPAPAARCAPRCGVLWMSHPRIIFCFKEKERQTYSEPDDSHLD